MRKTRIETEKMVHKQRVDYIIFHNPMSAHVMWCIEVYFKL